jgi:hypothetical protein
LFSVRVRKCALNNVYSSCVKTHKIYVKTMLEVRYVTNFSPSAFVQNIFFLLSDRHLASNTQNRIKVLCKVVISNWRMSSTNIIHNVLISHCCKYYPRDMLFIISSLGDNLLVYEIYHWIAKLKWIHFYSSKVVNKILYSGCL